MRTNAVERAGRLVAILGVVHAESGRPRAWRCRLPPGAGTWLIGSDAEHADGREVAAQALEVTDIARVHNVAARSGRRHDDGVDQRRARYGRQRLSGDLCQVDGERFDVDGREDDVRSPLRDAPALADHGSRDVIGSSVASARSSTARMRGRRRSSAMSAPVSNVRPVMLRKFAGSSFGARGWTDQPASCIDGGGDVRSQGRAAEQLNQPLPRFPLTNPAGGLAERGR